MPIYEYGCAKCHEVIEVIQKFSDPDLRKHERCGGKLNKLVSAPSVRVKEANGLSGSTHSSILRFRENRQIAASKKKKTATVVNLPGRGKAKEVKSRIIAVVMAMALARPLLAQTSSSTLAETLDWLKKYLGGAACVVFQLGRAGERLEPFTENTEVRFSDCDMTLETARTVGPKSELRTFRLPLGSLAPDSVTLSPGFEIPPGSIVAGEVPAYTMHLAAPAGVAIQASLEEFGAAAPPLTAYRTDKVNILLLHAETATQLQTALSRAIALCRQKKN